MAVALLMCMDFIRLQQHLEACVVWLSDTQAHACVYWLECTAYITTADTDTCPFQALYDPVAAHSHTCYIVIAKLHT